MAVVLYERQRQILDFLMQFIQKNGYSPTLQDIADAMGLSSLATVHEHLKNLKKKGVIKVKGRGKERSIKIIDEEVAKTHSGVRLPILGYLEDQKNIEPYPRGNAAFWVPNKMVSDRNRCFILEVKEDSLKQEGILDGDLLVIEEETENIKDGQIVVGLIEEEKAVLRKFFQEATRIRLESIVSKQRPVFTTELQVQGILINLLRRY